MNAHPDPAVAALRHAVRLALADVPPGRRLMVACSGGPDSLALAAVSVFEAARAGWLVGAAVVDHGLHRDSAEVAATVAARLTSLPAFEGIDPVEVVPVTVTKTGGPEGAARTARYEALRGIASRHDALVLLGHTRDDQAETVLLGLARGSGNRSLAGMRPALGVFRRPLLGVTRAQTRQACEALGLPVWHDPDNDDDRFARVRVRRNVLPLLEDQLGPGVAEALARTAELARSDSDALDLLAGELAAAAGLDRDLAETSPGGVVRLSVPVLAAAPVALRSRALRLAALAAGCGGGELFVVHVRALDALVYHWHGQGTVDLPGLVGAERVGDLVVLSPRQPSRAHS